MSVLDLEVSDSRAIVANLFARNERFQRDARQLNGDYAEYTRALTEQLAPKDTWFMANHVRKDFSPDLLRFSVGWRAEDFTSRGFDPYYLYQELGTIYMPAQPSLGPAWQEMEPYYIRDLSALMRTRFTEGS